MATILLAGGTGLIGMHLSQLLTGQGHRVLHLSREADPEAKYPAYAWDIKKGTVDEAAIRLADYVINLAGAGIADQRWSDKRKRVIIASRTEGTRLLKDAFVRLGHRPKAYLAASAIGYYGSRGDQLLTEDDKPGTGFLAESTILWEKAIAEVAATGIRTLAIRTGIVLSTKGGALEKMLQPTTVFASTYFGDGQQWYSWIHINDLCRLYLAALDNDTYEGFYNGVAPAPVRNITLAQDIKTAKDKPVVVLPVPAFVLHLVLGEMAHTVLDSARVSAEKAKEAGFTFDYPQLLPALQHLLESKT